VQPGVVSAIYWALLDFANQGADRGAKRGDIGSFDIESYAAWSGFPEADVQAVIDALDSKGMIRVATGRISAWDRRQAAATPKERKAAQRERERASSVH